MPNPLENKAPRKPHEPEYDPFATFPEERSIASCFNGETFEIDDFNNFHIAAVEVIQNDVYTVVDGGGTQVFKGQSTGRRGSEVRIVLRPETEEEAVALVFHFHKGSTFGTVQLYEKSNWATAYPDAWGLWRD